MKTRAWSIGIVLVSLSFVNAQDGSPYEKALQKVVDSFEKIATSLKTIVDEDSAAAAKPELKKAATTFLETRAGAAKLDPPEKAEKLRLEKTYKPKLEAAMKKMFSEVIRVNAIPGGKDALKEISGVLKKESK